MTEHVPHNSDYEPIYASDVTPEGLIPSTPATMLAELATYRAMFLDSIRDRREPAERTRQSMRQLNFLLDHFPAGKTRDIYKEESRDDVRIKYNGVPSYEEDTQELEVVR